ncbi:hypothetical protein BCR36DRAFT_8911 [Piromyces finnis]|uniref:Phosducin domain-containing protein n=1 Tax=Piromyces finnis TaxID=1754191 RepID=A0A1Y1VEX9_9FUNG|nr:hypothetical protein BCR36DRAFT_8911 [Piromyces finnis]|eukprot:ORX54637.1 hypothetical protein BCR36DRAFT_8911 [Piromyces finnis]
MSLPPSDEAIINAIKRQNDPDIEPYRGSDDESTNGEEEETKPVERQRMDPEIERILEDQQLRQSLSHQGGAATGPKGVIADYKFHQKQNALRREQNEREIQANINKGSMASGWIQRQIEQEEREKFGETVDAIEDKKNENTISMKELNNALDEHNELDELLEDDDEFMIQYRQKRLTELKRIAGRTRYGTLYQIGVNQFVDAIDNEDSRTAVIIHLFQPHNEQCKLLNQYLIVLAEKYRLAKFLCIISTEADPNFDEIALPTLLCYRNKELVANLVRVTDDLPTMDNGMFDIDDLEKLLLNRKALIKDDILDITNLSINGPMTGSNSRSGSIRELANVLNQSDDEDDFSDDEDFEEELLK